MKPGFVQAYRCAAAPWKRGLLATDRQVSMTAGMAPQSFVDLQAQAAAAQLPCREYGLDELPRPRKPSS